MCARALLLGERAQVCLVVVGVHREIFLFDQIGQFRVCQEPLWARFKAKNKYRQCQGEPTGFSSWLGPKVFPRWVWSC